MPIQRTLLLGCLAVVALQCQTRSPKSAPAKNQETDPARIIARTSTSIVEVHSRGSIGTGFFVDRLGHIATVRHLFVGPDGSIDHSGITVDFRKPGTAGKEESDYVTFTAALIDNDPDHDLALLKTNENPFESIKTITVVSIDDSPRSPGEEILVSGHALGCRNIVSMPGMLSLVDIPPRFDGRLRVSQYVYFAAMIVFGGHSGAPVFLSRTGSVIGVAKGSMTSDVLVKGMPGSGAAGIAATLTGNQITLAPEKGPAYLTYENGLAEIVPVIHAVKMLKQNAIAFSSQ